MDVKRMAPYKIDVDATILINEIENFFAVVAAVDEHESRVAKRNEGKKCPRSLYFFINFVASRNGSNFYMCKYIWNLIGAHLKYDMRVHHTSIYSVCSQTLKCTAQHTLCNDLSVSQTMPAHTT